MPFINPWPAERNQCLAELAELHPLASSTRITEMMSERLGTTVSRATVTQKLIAIRGPRRIVADDKQKAEFFEFVAKHSDLSFTAIAKLYSKQAGIEMDSPMARRWYWSVARKEA